MSSNPTPPAYHSYLIRCWTTPEPPNCHSPGQQRFMVETISAQPHRWGFDSLADLIAFLQAELGATTKPMDNDP